MAERTHRWRRGDGGTLTHQQRQDMAKSEFVFPADRRYPIPDIAHGRNALARVAQHGTPEEKAKVRAAVHRRFPSIGDEAKSERADKRYSRMR